MCPFLLLSFPPRSCARCWAAVSSLPWTPSAMVWVKESAFSSTRSPGSGNQSSWSSWPSLSSSRSPWWWATASSSPGWYGSCPPEVIDLDPSSWRFDRCASAAARWPRLISPGIQRRKNLITWILLVRSGHLNRWPFRLPGPIVATHWVRSREDGLSQWEKTLLM